MKKEYFITTAVAFFVLSYVLDFLGGSIYLPIKNPFEFLTQQMLSTYPFTAVSIAFKTLAVFIGALVLLSAVEKKYLAKGAFLIFLSAMMELYSIQQLATGAQSLPIVWSVAISYSGILFFIPAVIFLIWGFAKTVHNNISSASGGEVDPKQEL